MRLTFKLIIIILFNLSFSQYAFSDNHNIYETLEIIKNDLKTLERAVYSGSIEISSSSNEQPTNELDNNSEDVLTRHLLKLSEVEDQFRELTNKFEEINFKLDKLSNRLSKIQADNQIRFQDIESAISLRENGPTPAEKESLAWASKSLVAKKNIKFGQIISIEDLESKRPGIGIAPSFIEDLVGRTAKKDIQTDEVIKWEFLSWKKERYVSS